MKKSITIGLIFVGLIFSGCYNAKVTTNQEPSAKTVQNSFAHGFIFGLVGPTVDVSEDCTNGVAKVETKLSFVNMLVSNITAGLYTPMSVTVTCAAGNMTDLNESKNKTMTVEKEASEEDVQKTYQEAANEAIEKGEAVYIKFK
ncbi:Bor/Iss family lipoprotein [Gracilimonas sp.]|uniref:Bor/Iss family lipoprotein n=1 Tax=Gracilimonas sp. TaxID=1974203 RepID=UPI00287228FC|nr:hypothetical protein [Gracilimonas sp.]